MNSSAILIPGLREIKDVQIKNFLISLKKNDKGISVFTLNFWTDRSQSKQCRQRSDAPEYNI